MIRLGMFLLAMVLPGLAFAADVNLDGKSLFAANCAMCHGSDGSVSKYGHTLKPYPARNLRAVAGLVDRDELRRIISYGIQGTAMTPKKYILDPLQIEAVIDYIQTFDYKPNLANGKKRFKSVCISCHGADGRAKTGVGAINLVYSKLDLEGIVHTMRYGRSGTLMTSKRHQLSNTDIADVANYVYSLRYVSNPSKGQSLYAAKCASCHATPRAISLRGNAASKVSLSELSDRLLTLRILHGRHVDRSHHATKGLSEDDMQDLVAYIRHQTH